MEDEGNGYEQNNRQSNNKSKRERSAEQLLVGWMTRAVVHGDASTLVMYKDVDIVSILFLQFCL